MAMHCAGVVAGVLVRLGLFAWLCEPYWFLTSLVRGAVAHGGVCDQYVCPGIRSLL